MESSKIFGVAEECHSSESGWTMYIGSPIDGENDGDTNDPTDDPDDDNDDNDDNSNNANNHDNDDNNNSDDSMASDASSGPSHRESAAWGNEKYGHGTGQRKNQEVSLKGKNYSQKNDIGINSMDKNRYGKWKEEKERSGFSTARGGRFPVESDGKVKKKNSYGGNRK